MISSWWISRQDFQQSNTESNLFIIENNRHYDYLIMGNSHARNFSRHGNHERVSKIWQKDVLNIGQGLGICGTNDQLLYLKYTLEKNITFNKLIYPISPPYLYGAHLNHSTKTFFREPFRFDFLQSAVKHPAPEKIGRLHHYLRSKLRPLWFSFHPENSQYKEEALVQINSSLYQDGFALAYPFGRRERDFQECVAQLEETIFMAEEQGANVLLLTTPALFGHWPGQERVARYCDSLVHVNPKVTYLDLSRALQDPSLFYDHHHLNSKGIDSLATLMKAQGL